MARETGLYRTQLSQKKDTLWRDLKGVSFYLRRPRVDQKTSANAPPSKKVRNAPHLTIRFKDLRQNDLMMVRLTAKEARALSFFVLLNSWAWKRPNFRGARLG